MNPPRPDPAGGASLGAAQRWGYGVGDFGFNLFFTTATFYLLFYYTEVLGLSPAAAGWVFAGALIWDAIFDPLMGYVASRTRTRWGRYRPYLLFGGLPLAASWALIFFPSGLTGTALIVFAAVAHVLFRTCFAMVSMPYLALSAVLTRDSHERGLLASARMTLAALCGLLSAILTFKLVGALGGGQTGFFWTAVIYGAIALAMFLVVFASTREIVSAENEAKPALREVIRMLRMNRAFWLVGAATLIAGVGSTFFQKILPYYFKYQLGREDLIGPALAILAGTVMVTIVPWTWVMQRWSKRIVWLSGIVVSMVGSMLLWIAPATPYAVLPPLVLIGAGAAAGYLSFWAMMPDTIEYGEWRSGTRAEGAVFGFVTLIQKASLGFAAAAVGELLGAIGYRANVPQTADTLAAMRVIMIALPALLSLAAGAVIFFYPIDSRFHGRIEKVISRRRARISA